MLLTRNEIFSFVSFRHGNLFEGNPNHRLRLLFCTFSFLYHKFRPKKVACKCYRMMNDKPRNSYSASLRSNNSVTRSVIFDKQNFATKPTKEEATGHNIADNLITIIAKIVFMVYSVAQCMTTAFCLCNKSTVRSLLSFNMKFICFKAHSINK